MKPILVITLFGIVKAFSPSPALMTVLKGNVYTGILMKQRPPLPSSSSLQKVREALVQHALHQSSQDNNEKSSIDVMMGMVDIPDEYKEEIFRAEANTPAAKDRATRIVIFATLAFIGIGISSFNAFLTNIRDGTDLTVINELGFGWVSGNPLTSFLFLNKLGGGLALLSAGLGGTMVELEQRTKNENAEKIWTEFQRRKSQAATTSGKKKNRNKKRKLSDSPSKKKMSKKNRKRLDALSEVIMEEADSSTGEIINDTAAKDQQESIEKANVRVASQSTETENTGIFGKVKDFYEQADSMAQSQAMMLNKELEDRGVVEKITDETGLKVIGKEEAAKIRNKDKGKQ